MKPAGNLISAAAEFSSGMKNRKDNLNSRFFCLMIHSHRNSSAVINDRNRIILINLYFNFCTIPCQSLVDRIVHNFINKMMETSGRRRSDIHTRSFSDSLQTFQNLNLVSSIFICYCCQFLVHSVLLFLPALSLLLIC